MFFFNWQLLTLLSGASSFFIQLQQGSPRCFAELVPSGTRVHAGAGLSNSLPGVGNLLLAPKFNASVSLKIEVLERANRTGAPTSLLWTSEKVIELSSTSLEIVSDEEEEMISISLCVSSQYDVVDTNKPFDPLPAELVVGVEVLLLQGIAAGDYRDEYFSQSGMSTIDVRIAKQAELFKDLAAEVSLLRSRDFSAEELTDEIFTYLTWITVANIGMLISIGALEVYQFRRFLKKKKII